MEKKFRERIKLACFAHVVFVGASTDNKREVSRKLSALPQRRGFAPRRKYKFTERRMTE
ncbi:MAG: hypothetical protein K2N74_00160 [Clostridiales bacterium]|nr:hypothetical protein [Clostridiales bacterium]